MLPMHERFNVVLRFVEVAELVTARSLGERVLAAPLPPASTSAPDLFPPPELTWLLFSLMHYQQRKIWAFELFETRIKPKLPQKLPKPMVSIKDVLNGRREGLVPGMPDWSYEIDGNRSFVRNRATGEDIHIDVINGPRLICNWAFIGFLEKHRTPNPACGRLLELHPHRSGLECTLAIFRDCWPEHQVDETDFELCGMFAPHDEAVERFCARWLDGTHRLWNAAVISDWRAAYEAARSPTDGSIRQNTLSRAQQSRRSWLDMLRARILSTGWTTARCPRSRTPEPTIFGSTSRGRFRIGWGSMQRSN